MATFAALLLLLAGCGGDDKTTAASGGPSELAPASGTVLYGEVLLDPGEERSDEIRETLEKVAGRDLLDLLVAEIDESMKEEGNDVTYEADIKPVLGERAGVFLMGFKDDFDGAAIFDLEDVEGAQKLLDDNMGAGDRKADYKGVSYWSNSDDGSAAGVVEGRMVVGSAAGFKAAVDTAKAAKLSDSAPYKAAVGKLDEERLAHLYVDTAKVLEVIKAQFGAQAGAALEQAEKQLKGKDGGAAVGLNLTKTGLVVEAAANAGKLENSGEASDLIEQFPADAWFAFAAKGISTSLGEGFTEGFREGFEESSGGISPDDFAKQFEQATGVKPDAKLLESIEEIGMFAGGTSLFSLKAGIVARSTDAGKLLADLAKIAKGMGPQLGAQVSDLGEGFLIRIPGVPFQVAAGRKDDLVALGLGEPGLKQILEPSDRLGDSDDFKKVSEQLGDDFRPLLFVLEKPLMTLAQSFGQDLGPEFEEVRQYIDAFSHIAVGTSGGGDDTKFKIGVGLD